MLKKLTVLAGLMISLNAFSADTVINGKVWSVEYNTGSAFYSAIKGKQEITMECLLGDMTFALHDDETGLDFNSRDNHVGVIVDGVIYSTPKTLKERRAFYDTVLHASDSIMLQEVNSERSKAFPIKELRQLFQSIEFDLSDCKE
ncbi:hypothetical protein pEaSNUABM37_00301 [Erwinia phage pEa_SNUABM_37]|nr:hypothetical protein pEaSNUABM37_00301 [Erwinia phage pEa_SNUABM_37]QXO10769.1 hypothetical protein pEaSNUABM48_00301 [Erwinia phage pEa_SNUABM_48]